MLCGGISELYDVQVMITAGPGVLYRVSYVHMSI
jgi:hypothetical protein